MGIHYDLIVVGGGTAGVFSALAAAKEGLKVAIVEKNSYLGGMITGSGLTEMNAVGFKGKPLYSGIEGIFFEKLIEKNAGEYHFKVPMSSNKNVKIDRLRYDPEKAKILLEEMVVSYNIDIFYTMELLRAKEYENYCVVEIANMYEKLELKGNYLIDATGNAYLAKSLGEETLKVDKDNQLVATLMFRISNVDLEKLNGFIHSNQITEVINQGYESGILKGKILAFTPIPGTKDVSLNVTRAKFDFENTMGLTKGLIESRMQIEPIFNFVKEKVTGLENSYISNIAPVIGVREARQVAGRYTLTIDDLENMTEFEDFIAWGCYPMDIHDPKTNSVVWKELPGVYYIPYSSIVPKTLNRTLVVGKALSADRKAFGAIRVMPIMMNVGESAGYIVAIANRENENLNQIDVSVLREKLDEKYGGLK